MVRSSLWSAQLSSTSPSPKCSPLLSSSSLVTRVIVTALLLALTNLTCNTEAVPIVQDELNNRQLLKLYLYSRHQLKPNELPNELLKAIHDHVSDEGKHDIVGSQIDDNSMGQHIEKKRGFAPPSSSTNRRWSQNYPWYQSKRDSSQNEGHHFHTNGLQLKNNNKPADGNAADELMRLRSAVSMWEAKLDKFAEQFVSDPQLLNHNPTWIKLLQVRDRLRILLRRAEEAVGLDQTRM